jgi:hypothetical protein
VRQESVHHTLGVAVRIDDHFIEAPIPDELDVRIDTYLFPTLVQSGAGHRHDDGTYRFLDLADGPHQLQIKSADDRWMMLDPLPVIVTPLGPPPLAIKIEAWPTPVQATPLGMTAVRGKLVGTPAATIGRRIDLAIGSPAVDSGHHTQTSSSAEFLFLLPGRLELDADSLVDLVIAVTGGTVTGGEVVAGELVTPFTGATFKIAPGRETRVRFFVT